LDDLVDVKEVNGLDPGDCVFLYSPPEGEIFDAGAICENVILKYGDSGEDQFERKIQFNQKNGIANITNPSSEDEGIAEDN